MEREAFFSGYCRMIDGSRTVTVEAEDNRMTEVDCCFATCIHAPSCPIANNIREFLHT